MNQEDGSEAEAQGLTQSQRHFEGENNTMTARLSQSPSNNFFPGDTPYDLDDRDDRRIF